MNPHRLVLLVQCRSSGINNKIYMKFYLNVFSKGVYVHRIYYFVFVCYYGIILGIVNHGISLALVSTTTFLVLWQALCQFDEDTWTHHWPIVRHAVDCRILWWILEIIHHLFLSNVSKKKAAFWRKRCIEAAAQPVVKTSKEADRELGHSSCFCF